VANTIASHYLSENTRVRGQEASGTATFLRKQLEEVKGRLEDQETRLSAFKRRHIGENPRNMDANLAVLERLTAQLRLNSDNQNRALERREALGRALAGNEGGVVVTGSGLPEPVDPMVSRLARLHQELAELRTRFSDRYPDVVRVKAEIAALEMQAAGTTKEVGGPRPEPAPNPNVLKIRQAIAETEVEITALKAEERRLREDFATYQRRVENTPLREQEFQELSRDYDTTSELYRTLLKRYEEAQLAEVLEQRQKGEQFRILEAAVPPASPWAPNRSRLVLVGGALSLGLAAGLMLLAEWLDTSFHDVDELRNLTNVPVVGRIPRIVGERDAARRWLRAAAWSGVTATAIVLTVGAAYATAKGHVPVASGVAHSLLLRP
jgi:polysaccharide chain length determinant protein (PEP-CTERM system associated)